MSSIASFVSLRVALVHACQLINVELYQQSVSLGYFVQKTQEGQVEELVKSCIKTLICPFDEITSLINNMGKYPHPPVLEQRR